MDSRSTNPFSNKMFGVESKNVGPFLAFGHDWFEKYQSILLLLLNFPILKLWSRWILRINKDLKYSERICKIDPTRYFVQLSDNQFRLDARTHPKFSKRIYFAFRYWWWMLHYIDEALSWLKFNPEFSFGFDTLTVYPEPNGGTFAGDAFIHNWRNATWQSHHDSTSSDYISTSLTSDYMCRLYTSGDGTNFQDIGRSIFNFDTSSLLETDTISAVSLWFCESAGNSSNYFGDLVVNIVSCSKTDFTNFSKSDYSKLGVTSFGSKNSYSWTNQYEYQEFSLNSNGVAYINKNAITSFGIRYYDDLINSPTFTWTGPHASYRSVYFADYTGTTRDPKLVVTYSAAPTTHIAKANNTAYANIKKYINTAIANVKKINNIE